MGMSRTLSRRQGTSRSYRPKRGPAPMAAASERLVSVAIIRDGVIESRGFRSHWELRAALGDESPSQSRPGDQEGFLTSEGRYVDRRAACAVGVASGQLNSQWLGVPRPLLSSDIW